MGANDRGIPLLLARDGVRSRAAIEAYIVQVIRERTMPNADTSAERLARGITTSVLHRLGASYPVAAGLPGAESMFPQPGRNRPAADLYEAVGHFTDSLDRANGSSREELGLRLLKVAEETGEMSAAWIGYVGQNPRKGLTHSLDDVVGELADVVLTALVAMRSLGAVPSAVMATCVEKVNGRLGESPPEAAHEWRGTADAPPQYGRCSHGNICLINGDHLVHPLGDRCTDPPDPRWTHEERSC